MNTRTVNIKKPRDTELDALQPARQRLSTMVILRNELDAFFDQNRFLRAVRCAPGRAVGVTVFMVFVVCGGLVGVALADSAPKMSRVSVVEPMDIEPMRVEPSVMETSIAADEEPLPSTRVPERVASETANLKRPKRRMKRKHKRRNSRRLARSL